MSAGRTVSADVAVLGAGPAGLLAAWRLARMGRSVVVYERAAAVGGLAGSFTVAGVRVDHGSHRLHPSIEPSLLADLRGLLGADLQMRRRRGRIRLEDRWVDFPLRAGNLLRRLPPSFAGRLAVDVIGGPFRRSAGGDAASVIRSRLGPTMAARFYGPYLTKLWGVPPSELSSEVADRRISATSGGSLVRRAVGRGGRSFWYPRRGFGQISEALADAAVGVGADIRLGSEVRSLDLDAATVLSTIPVGLLPGLGGAPPAVVEAAGRLRHRAVVLVYVVLDAGRFTAYDAHYFPGLDVSMSRLSEPKGYRSSTDDPPGVTVVCAEVPCWEGDDTWTAPATELGARVVDELRRCGLAVPGVLDVEVRRIARCYPVFAGSYAWDLAVVEAWVDGLDRVLTLGRQGLFVADNTHHVLRMAAAAADAVGLAGAAGEGGGIDRAGWSAARESFRAHVVAD